MLCTRQYVCIHMGYKANSKDKWEIIESLDSLVSFWRRCRRYSWNACTLYIIIWLKIPNRKLKKTNGHLWWTIFDMGSGLFTIWIKCLISVNSVVILGEWKVYLVDSLRKSSCFFLKLIKALQDKEKVMGRIVRIKFITELSS